MSAAAFVIGSEEEGAVFLSDGVMYTFGADSRIHGTTARKVWKLRGSTALIWMGARTDNIEAVVKSVRGLNAENAIHAVAAILKRGLANDSEALAILDDNNPYNIFTFEARDGFVQYWRLFYHQDKFIPTFRGNLYPGATGALCVDRPNPIFTELIREYQSPDKSAETVGLEAFEEMIRRYKAAGVRVGGRIFRETIKPCSDISLTPHETSYLMNTPG